MTQDHREKPSKLRAVSCWLQKKQNASNQRSAERKALIAAMPRSRRIALTLGHVTICGSFAAGVAAGWSATATLGAMGAYYFLMPFLEPRRPSLKKFFAPALIHPVIFIPLIIAVINSVAPGFLADKAFPTHEIVEANTDLRANMELFVSEIQQMEDDLKDNKLTLLYDKRITYPRMISDSFLTRNDRFIAEAFNYIARQVGKGIDTDFSGDTTMPLGSIILADRIVVLANKEGVLREAALRKSKAEETFGRPASELTHEELHSIEVNTYAPHVLFCTLRGEEVMTVQPGHAGIYFDNMNAPQSAPLRNICAEVAKVDDLSSMPPFQYGEGELNEESEK